MARIEIISRMFALLRANWPKYPFTDATTEVYTRCLRDIPNEVLAAATAHCITACRFFPVVAEIREAAFDIMSNRVNELSAQEAWGFLIKKVNQYDHPELPGLVRQALNAIGGPRRLIDSDNYAADRARFIEAYQVLAKRQRQVAQMLPEIKELTERLSLEAAIKGKRLNGPTV